MKVVRHQPVKVIAWLGFDSRRLHHFSPVKSGDFSFHLPRLPYIYPPAIRNRLIEEPNRALDCSRAEVHVTLRRREIGMTRQLLNSSSRCALHRQV